MSELLWTGIEQENSKDPGDIGKLGLGPRAPTKKTKCKQPPMGTAQLNDRNKPELTTANVVATHNHQMALLQRQSAGLRTAHLAWLPLLVVVDP